MASVADDAAAPTLLGEEEDCCGTASVDHAITITLLGILRCAVGISFYVGGIILAVLLIILSELIEVLYYKCCGRGERDLGPRKDLNGIIFMSLVLSIIIMLWVSFSSADFIPWPMSIYVVFGNALETAFLICYKVNGKRNWTLAMSKALMTIANTVIIIWYYSNELDWYSYIMTGGLYALHGITLSFGLFEYYSYPINQTHGDNEVIPNT